MPPLTRRRALQGAAGLLAALAGCPDRTSDSSPTPTVPADRPRAGGLTDPAHVVLRHSEGPAAWFADPDRGQDPTAVESENGRTRGLIASDAVAETLSVAEGASADATATETAPGDGVAAASDLVAGTDFDSETLFLDQRRVGECYRLELCYVDWTPTEFETQYGRILRDHDVACSADAADSVAVLIRVPAALDPDERASYSSGVHSGSCDRIPEERRYGGGTPRPPGRTATDDVTATDGSSGGSDE